MKTAYLVQLRGKRAGVKLSKLVGGLEALDTGLLGLLRETVPLSLVGLDALVHLLESKASRADLRVLISVLVVTNTGGEGRGEKTGEEGRRIGIGPAYHGPLAEIGRVGHIVVLMKKVLEEGDATVKVDVNPLPELLLALDGGHHDWLRLGEGRGGPLAVLGILNELAQLLVEVEADVEVEIAALFIEMAQTDALAVHVGVLHELPRHPANGWDR